MTAPSTTNRDNHATHIWFNEPLSEGVGGGGVLTEDGLDQIVHHQYKAGTYTFLDSQLNPLWQYLTDQLPMWLAPNTVTALGGCFTLISYLVTWMYSFDFEQNVPSTVLILNGFCLMLYYTLDCMDGKQARRTGSSSPLGQLFDHGCDCLANLSHLSLMQSILRLSPYQYMLLQLTMQMGFFQAQLEEYYTGSLPHAAGNVGTTEVLYGMSLWSMTTGAMEWAGVGWDRNHFYGQSMKVPSLLKHFPTVSFLLDSSTTTAAATTSSTDVTLRDGIITFWVCGFAFLSVLSWIRILYFIFYTKHPSGVPIIETYRLVASAASKWISPVILCALALGYSSTVHKSSSNNNDNHDHFTTENIRYPSLCFGLCFCFLTIKLVVFGMARMAYSSIQWPDLLPLMMMMIVLTTVLSHEEEREDNSSGDWMSWMVNILKARSQHYLYGLLTLGYLARLVLWTRSVVNPLCRRMNIRLFRINIDPSHQKKNA